MPYSFFQGKVVAIVKISAAFVVEHIVRDDRVGLGVDVLQREAEVADVVTHARRIIDDVIAGDVVPVVASAQPACSRNEKFPGSGNGIGFDIDPGRVSVRGIAAEVVRVPELVSNHW